MTSRILVLLAAAFTAVEAAYTPNFFTTLVKQLPSGNMKKTKFPTTSKSVTVQDFFPVPSGSQKPKIPATTTTFRENIFENELGAQAPLGFFDPLGVVNNGDRDKFDRLRFTELKHGRVCMLGVVGYLATEAGMRVPAFADLPAGFAAVTAIPDWGFYQVLFFIGILETEVMKDAAGTGEFGGDFRNGWALVDPGWDTFDDKTKLEKRAIELNQGRAAMMGMLALMVHEKLGVSILPTELFK